MGGKEKAGAGQGLVLFSYHKDSIGVIEIDWTREGPVDAESSHQLTAITHTLSTMDCGTRNSAILQSSVSIAVVRRD